MQIQPNFTAKYEYAKTDEERKYKILKEGYIGAESVGSAALIFGFLETIDKISLTKNKQNRTFDELAILAKKNTKRNLLIGLAAGILAYIITWPAFKKMEPFNLKLQDWTDKQNRIAEKAEELVKEEDLAKKKS